MDDYPKMLYKAGGTEPIHGGRFSTLIVADEAEHDAATLDGWHETTTEAKEAALPVVETPTDNAPPTRDELEAKALELGIAYDRRWGDKRLADAIAAKLTEK